MGGPGSGRRTNTSGRRSDQSEREKFVERNDPQTCLERAEADRANAAAATTENQRHLFEMSAGRWLARAKLLSRVKKKLR